MRALGCWAMRRSYITSTSVKLLLRILLLVWTRHCRSLKGPMLCYIASVQHASTSGSHMRSDEKSSFGSIFHAR
jgi:hypothetical protein